MKLRSFVVATLALLTACDPTDTTEAGIAMVAGTYQLSTVNGQPLPFTESAATPVVRLTASQLVARSDGTFTETSTRTTTTPAGATTTTTATTTGTYSVGGQVVSFVSSSGPDFTGLGSYNPDILTIPVDSRTRVYSRQ